MLLREQSREWKVSIREGINSHVSVGGINLEAFFIGQNRASTIIHRPAAA
jgi:hypothetical protein